MTDKNINWDATAFFASLTETNKFAKAHDFVFAKISGLDGFEEALQQLQSATAIIAVSDISQGYIEVNNSPHTRRVKTVFLAMRHAIDDMAARQLCMFRQFMSKLILEKTKQEQHNIYLDSRISFQEIDQYFFSGCACAFFQIAVDTYTDLRYDPSEWQ